MGEEFSSSWLHDPVLSRTDRPWEQERHVERWVDDVGTDQIKPSTDSGEKYSHLDRPLRLTELCSQVSLQ